MTYKDFDREVFYTVNNNRIKIKITISRFFNVRATLYVRDGCGMDIQTRLSKKTGKFLCSMYDSDSGTMRITTYEHFAVPEKDRERINNAFQEMKMIAKLLKEGADEHAINNAISNFRLEHNIVEDT